MASAAPTWTALIEKSLSFGRVSTSSRRRASAGVRAVELDLNKQPSRPIFSSCSGRLPGVVALSKARLATVEEAREDNRYPLRARRRGSAARQGLRYGQGARDLAPKHGRSPEPRGRNGRGGRGLGHPGREPRLPAIREGLPRRGERL